MKLDFASGRGPETLVSRVAAGLVGSEILKIAADIRALQARGADVLNLTVGDFAPKQFPLPPALKARIFEAFERGETNYPPSNGMPQLREAIARTFARDLGLEYPTESVLVAGGARPIIYGTYRTLVDPGDAVVYPAPSWNNNHYCHLMGARPVRVMTTPETNFLPTARLLEPHLKGARLLALCSPQNPTGTCFDADALGEICDLVLAENRRRGAAERPLYVMFDQVYWTLTFDGVKHATPVALRPALAPYVVFVDGLSKAFSATGLRVGYGVGPPEIMKRMSDALGHVGAWAPRPEQVASAAFLDDVAAVSAFKKEFIAGARLRLHALHDGFSKLRDQGLAVQAIEPMGAIYLTVRFDVVGRRTPEGATLATNEDVRRYVLDRAGLGVVPFQSFDYQLNDGWFRCSIGAVGVDEIETAMPRLGRALAALQ
jgi:aspartate aminotransferase